MGSTVDQLEQRRLLANPVADAGGPYTVAEGSTVTIDGGDSTDDGQIVAYAWDLNYRVSRGFQRSLTGQAFTYEATDNAVRTIALRVTDNDGDTHLTTTTITTTNVDPVITLGGESTAEEGQEYTLTWSISDAGPDTMNGYSIDWGDDTTSTADAEANNATHTYAEDGTYTIELSATDEDGTFTQTKQITVNNVAPVIDAELDDSTVNEGDQVRITYSSPNRAATIDQWIIDWGDDSVNVRPASTHVSTHTYADSGVYTITITALEFDGGTSEETLTVTVNNEAPTLELSGLPEESPEGTALTVIKNVSDNSNDGFTYEWTLEKDGDEIATSTTSGNYSFTPTDNGEYTVTLTVTDDDGGETTASASVTITNVAPQGSVNATIPDPFVEGTTVEFTSNTTDAGSADTHEYLWLVEKNGDAWSIPNGVTVDEETFSFTPTDNGEYIVSLVITDDDEGQYVAGSSTLTVTNAPPTASIVRTDGISTPEEGDILSFNASADDDGTEDALTYQWMIERDNVLFYTGEIGDDTSFSFEPTDNGTYEITVTVVDDDEDSATSNVVSVVVGNVAPTGELTGPEGDLVEGSSLGFSVDASDVGDEDVLSYLWSVTRNNVTYSLTGVDVDNSTFNFSPADEGDYVVTVVVSDDDSDDVTFNTSTIIVTNAPPEVSINETPTGVYEGDSVPFTLTVSDVGTGDTFTYAWEVLRGGEAFEVAPGTVVDEATFSFIPSDDGEYVVSVTVTDSDNADTTVSIEAFTVSNVAPLGTVDGEPPSPIDEGDSVSVSVTPTDAGSEDTFEYLWTVEKDNETFSLADNVDRESSSFTFTPNDNGTYTVSVLIIDDDGGEYLASSDAFTVDNVNPTAVITGGPAVETPSVEATLLSDAAGVVTSNGAWPEAYSLVGEDTGVQRFAIFKWTIPNGLTSAEVENATFTFSSYNTNGNMGEVNLYAFTTIHDTVHLDDYNDLANSNAILASDVFADGATAVVSTNALKNAIKSAIDNNETFIALGLRYAAAINETGITYIANTPGNHGQPTASLVLEGAPALAAIDEGSTQNFGVNVTDAGTADTHTYAWTVTKDNDPFTVSSEIATDESTFDFVPTDDGTYIITAVVTDDDNGAVTVSTQAIVVNNVDPAVTIDHPSGGTEGSQLTFEADVTDAGDDDTHTYAWTLTKNGNPVNLTGITTDESSFYYTPNDEGTFVATVVVTDDDGGTDTAVSGDVDVSNVAPTPEINNVPETSPEGTEIEVAGTFTDPGSIDTHTYLWSVTKDGETYDLTGVDVDESTFAFTPSDNGEYVISLTVADNDGDSNTVSTGTIDVTNVAPTGTVAGEPNGSIDEGTPVTLTVTPSDAGSLDTHTYAWSVERNGETFALPENADTNDATFTFTPTDDGEYVANVLITDNNEGEYIASSDPITVLNVAPTATISGVPLNSIGEGTAVSLTATPADAGAADTFSYSWSVTKDGDAFTLPSNTVTNAANFTFTPTDDGNYIATVVVADDDEGTVTESTATIVVTNVNPTGSVSGPTTGVEGSSLTFTANPSDAGSADTFSYSWSVTKGGNSYSLSGVTTNTSSLTFTPTDNGDYVASVVITDDNSGTVTANSSTVVVSNANPTGTITGVNSGVAAEGSTITLNSTHADVGSADTFTYSWSVTKGNQPYDLTGVTTNASSITFDVLDNGAYVATLVITDDDGGTVTKNKSINVTNANPDVDITVYPVGGLDEGDEAHYESVAIDPSPVDTISYAWTVTRNNATYVLPNNVVTTNSDFTFVPTLPGTYRVSVAVSDDDNGTSGEYHQLVVSNVAPMISSLIGPSTDVNRNSPVSYTAEITDPGAETFTYNWTVRLDGDVVTTSTDEEFEFTPTDAGEYVVSLVVNDGIDNSDAYSVDLNVINHAPVIESIAGIDNSIEGDSLSISTVASDEDDDALTYAWVVTRGETVVQQSDESEFDLALVQNGSYQVMLTVSDGVSTDTQTQEFSVANAAPVITSATATGTLIEGGNVTLAGVASDAGADDEVSFVWSVRREGSETVLASSDDASFVFVPTDDGSYVATLTVSDGSESDTETVNFTAANKLPTGTLVVPTYTGVRGWEQMFSIAEFTKYSGDAVTVDWNFGDGTDAVNGASPSASQGHYWWTAGTYTVTATLKDDDGGQTVLSHSFEVRDYGLQRDPMSDGVALVVTGTSANDVMTFSKLSNGRYRAVRNDVQLGTSFAVDRIYAYGEAGFNSLTASSNVTIPVVFYGGTSRDTLTGGGGDDVLLGRRGNDVLIGGAGRDILVGAGDNDSLDGGEGEDLLVGASFNTSENQTDLGIVAREWSNTSRAFSTRISRLQNGASGLFAFLGTGTVIKDAKVDTLVGGNASDWIFKDNESTLSDSVVGATSADRVTNA